MPRGVNRLPHTLSVGDPRGQHDDLQCLPEEIPSRDPWRAAHIEAIFREFPRISFPYRGNRKGLFFGISDVNHRVMSGQKFINIDPPEQDLFSNFYYRHTRVSEFIKGILRDLQVSQEFLTREVIVGHDALIYPKNLLQFKKRNA